MSSAGSVAQAGGRRFAAPLPYVLTGIAFAILFAKPMAMLVSDWWTNPEAGHGLLLFPVAIWLAWKSGIRADSRPNFGLGMTLLVFAVLIRAVSDLAAERYTMRLAMVIALAGLVIVYWGVRQLTSWWLPVLLVTLSIPFPELVTSALALPLQFRASRLGAALLEWRHVPVLLTGNIIEIPGHRLFVTEACSGLRSLTALLSVAVLTAGLWLRGPIMRILLVATAIPVAILINGVRVFLTGFLVYFVDPKLGEGFLHLTEGWLLFLVSMSIIASVAWVSARLERLVARRHVGLSPAPEVAHE